MNEIITSTPETVPSVEIQDLSNYLNDISTKVPKLNLSILPRAINDCATIFMEYKKMKIDDKQFNNKCKVINDYLQGQIKNQNMSIKFSHEERMHELDIYKSIIIAEIDAQKNDVISKIENDTLIKLEEIRSNEKKALKEIKSNEKTQIIKIKADYEIKRRAQDNDLYKFQENLKEESRRFNKQYKMAKHEQIYRYKFIKELQDTCRYINKKIVKGKASNRDINYSIQLWELLLMAFRDGFNFIQSVYMIFSGGNAH